VYNSIQSAFSIRILFSEAGIKQLRNELEQLVPIIKML